jgi:hypothetical protein
LRENFIVQIGESFLFSNRKQVSWQPGVSFEFLTGRYESSAPPLGSHRTPTTELKALKMALMNSDHR